MSALSDFIWKEMVELRKTKELNDRLDLEIRALRTRVRCLDAEKSSLQQTVRYLLEQGILTINTPYKTRTFWWDNTTLLFSCSAVHGADSINIGHINVYQLTDAAVDPMPFLFTQPIDEKHWTPMWYPCV